MSPLWQELEKPNKIQPTCVRGQKIFFHEDERRGIAKLLPSQNNSGLLTAFKTFFFWCEFFSQLDLLSKKKELE